MSDQTTSMVSAASTSDVPTLETTLQQKRLALGLISGCHVLNHLQYSITSVIFPVMMTELGFGLVGLGFISALSSFVGQGLQVIYGFLSNFFRRTTMLAVGNVMVGLDGDVAIFCRKFSPIGHRAGGHRCGIESAASARVEPLVPLLPQSPRLGSDVSSLGGKPGFIPRTRGRILGAALRRLAYGVCNLWIAQLADGTDAFFC